MIDYSEETIADSHRLADVDINLLSDGDMTDAEKLFRNVVTYADIVIRDAQSRGFIDGDWTAELDNAKCRAGACHYGREEITLSKVWMVHADLAEIENTILHELAHACTFENSSEHGHGEEWKNWCGKIGMTRIERCTDRPSEMPKGKYEAWCPTCEQPKGYRWRLNKNIRRYSLCSDCRTAIKWREL